MVYFLKKHRITLFVIFLAIIALFIYSKKVNDVTTLTPVKNNPVSLKTVTLRQGWFAWAGYAGEMFAMQETDSLNGINLIVEPGADDIDPVKMVVSGDNHFGITSAESIILANQKGAELVAIATINYKSPTCFISLPVSQIKSPKDFEGKKIGILTGSETETVYRALIDKLNINKKKIKEVEAPYDLKTFINHQYDVYPGFIYSEPLALDYQNIEYSIIKPEDYGVELMGAVYFTTQKFLKENPILVQSFVNSLADGWKKAIENPEKAITYLKSFDQNIDADRELASLKRGIDYFKGESQQILYSSDKSWSNLGRELYRLGKIKDTLSITQSYNYDFVEKYHNLK